ncbi:MAG: MFS transporter, partial [Pseudomonadota bacterium]
HISMTSMSRWFGANRGKALATAALGFSVAEAILPLSFVALRSHLCATTLWVMAAGLALVSMVIVRWLLKAERRPGDAGAEAQTVGRLADRHWQQRDALRHPLFWCVVPAILGPAALMTALFFHQIHFAETKGLSHFAFVSLIPVYTGSAVATVFSSGLLIDRFGAWRLLGLHQLVFAFGFWVMATSPSVTGLAVAMICLGVGSGGMSTIPAAFWAECYGTRYIGAIKALGYSVMVVGSALGPIICGQLIDLGVDLPDQLPGFSLFFLVSAVLATAGTFGMLRKPV